MSLHYKLKNSSQHGVSFELIEQLKDSNRREKQQRSKIEYVLPITLGTLKSTTGLDNALKYGNTVHTKPRDYFNRHKNVMGLIITKDSIFYKMLADEGRLSELIVYDEFQGRDNVT